MEELIIELTIKLSGLYVIAIGCSRSLFWLSTVFCEDVIVLLRSMTNPGVPFARLIDVDVVVTPVGIESLLIGTVKVAPPESGNIL